MATQKEFNNQHEFASEIKSEFFVKNEPMSDDEHKNGSTSEDENESSEAEIDSNNQLKRFKTDVNEFTYEEMPDRGYVIVKSEPVSGDEQDGGSEDENENTEGKNDFNTFTEIKQFHCKFCNKEFSKNSNFKRHLQLLHSGEIKCNEQNGDLSEDEHETGSNSLLKIKLFKCEFCNKEFLDNCNLTQHLKLHSDEIICNGQDGSENENENAEDLTGSNKEVKRFQCKFCNKVFSRKSNLKRHLKLHSDEINNQDGSSSESDNESVVGVSGSKRKRYKCEFCHKRFSRNSNLKRHLKLHSGKINGQDESSSCDNESVAGKRFCCKFCNKHFSKNSHLKSHLIIHSGVKDFICTICSREFSRKDSLEKHFKTHTGEKQYSCRVCNKQFIQKGNLRRHERIHSGIKEYKCLICNKEFLEERSMKKHAEIHYKEFKCTKCNKEFLRQEDFTKHLKFNSGVKECNQFECSVCHKQFITNKKLKSHMKIHSVLKEYKCTICKRQFTYKHYLVKHMKTHSYVKDFECAICKKQFSHKSSLRRHLEHHKNELKSKEQIPTKDMNIKQEPQDPGETNENCEVKADREFVFVKCEPPSSDEQDGGDSVSDD